jgi:NADH:ubiquinone oxidoreductase subunit K
MLLQNYIFFVCLFNIGSFLCLFFAFFSKYLIITYMSLELFLIFILSLFVLTASFCFSIKLQLLVLFLLVLIAVETALGLSLLIRFFRLQTAQK